MSAHDVSYGHDSIFNKLTAAWLHSSAHNNTSPLHCYIKFPVQCPLPSQQISDGKIDFTTAQGSSHVGLWLPKHISELLCAKGLSLLIYISFVMGDTSNS